MAHFYGNLKGSRGEATRCGTASSGLSVSARSWAGSVTVELSEGSDGKPRVTIRVSDGSAVGGRLLFGGSLDSLTAAATLRPVYSLLFPEA
jgi:hypothetical protein